MSLAPASLAPLPAHAGGVFVDWLTVSQYHGEGVPEFLGSLTFELDEAGHVRAEVGKGRRLQGSWGSSISIRSHAGRVSVSGNPTRWQRPDNLFGRDLDASMRVLNTELVRLGLPAFTPGIQSAAQVFDFASGQTAMSVLPEWSGATFSRIDLTRNRAAGSDFLARLAIKAYSGKSASYLRKSVYGDETAMFSNTRRTIKAYRKGPDMGIHCKESPWIDWATDAGIVRHELELKRRFLHDSNLRFWGNLDMGTLIKIFDRETASVLGNPQFNFEPIQLEILPRPTRVIYAAWLRGEDIRALVSRASFYRHRRVLADHGVDISEVRQTAHVVDIPRTIELRDVAPPLGYWQEAA